MARERGNQPEGRDSCDALRLYVQLETAVANLSTAQTRPNPAFLSSPSITTFAFRLTLTVFCRRTQIPRLRLRHPTNGRPALLARLEVSVQDCEEGVRSEEVCVLSAYEYEYESGAKVCCPSFLFVLLWCADVRMGLGWMGRERVGGGDEWDGLEKKEKGKGKGKEKERMRVVESLSMSLPIVLRGIAR